MAPTKGAFVLKTTATRIAEYEAAETAALKAQQLGKGDMNLVRAQLKEIRAALNELYRQYKIEQATSYPRTYAKQGGRGE